MKLKIYPIKSNYHEIFEINEKFYFTCLKDNHWSGFSSNKLFRFKINDNVFIVNKHLTVTNET
jgi:hypothetical protein